MLFVCYLFVTSFLAVLCYKGRLVTSVLVGKKTQVLEAQSVSL